MSVQREGESKGKCDEMREYAREQLVPEVYVTV